MMHILLEHSTNSRVRGVNHDRSFCFTVGMREQNNLRELFLDVGKGFVASCISGNYKGLSQVSFQKHNEGA